MTREQAIHVIDQALARVPANRHEHATFISALQLLVDLTSPPKPQDVGEVGE
jgi:hypothetical protein